MRPESLRSTIRSTAPSRSQITDSGSGVQRSANQAVRRNALSERNCLILAYAARSRWRRHRRSLRPRRGHCRWSMLAARAWQPARYPGHPNTGCYAGQRIFVVRRGVVPRRRAHGLPKKTITGAARPRREYLVKRTARRLDPDERSSSTPWSRERGSRPAAGSESERGTGVTPKATLRKDRRLNYRVVQRTMISLTTISRRTPIASTIHMLFMGSPDMQ